VAVGLILSSWFVVVYALSGSLLWNYVIRPLEEADLESRFGAPYRRYREEVRCWVPAFRRLSAAMDAGEQTPAPPVVRTD
jgi:protein-S-isoprenylcysteine O-methyltransferase Ste14